MKLTIYKKTTVLSISAFASLDPNVKPPPGFSPCATIECARIDEALKHDSTVTDVVIRDSPQALVSGLVIFLTMRSIPFRMTFEG